MSATIKIELDDKGARKKLDELGDEAKQAADAVDDMGKEAKQAGDATAKMGQQVDLAAKETQELQSQIQMLAGAYVAFEAGKAAVEALSSASTTLAERGSPAFVKLNDSVTAVQEALLNLGDDPVVQGLAESLAGGFESLGNIVAGIPAKVRAINDEAAQTIAFLGEQVGIFSSGTVDSLVEMQAEEKKSLELAKERIAAEQQLLLNKRNNAEFEKIMQALEQEGFRGTLVNMVSQIKTLEDVNAAQEDAIANMREMAAQNRITSQDLTNFQVRLQAFAVRRQQIAAEQARAEVEAAAERKRIADEEERFKRETLARDQARLREMTDLETKMREEMAKAGATAAAKQLEMMEQRVAKVAAAIAMLEGKADQGQGVLPQVRADDRDVKKRENALKRQEVERRLGEVEQERREALDSAAGADDSVRRGINRDFDKKAQQARKAVARQGKDGAFEGQARAEVENEMAGELIDRAERSGRLDREQVGALREAQRALATQRAEQEQMAAQLAQLTDAMRQLAKPVNNRARAQRMAGGV